ncbi:MAG: hypothetical protein DWQ34_09230 [Planctomycetota bacterium]|nr:MAG: hypothetical protein DWQ34_09230 [Planctomycetota bacterium]REJ96780.1 MAG: hypothetical protein DWQ29_00655 [Planctomycetota bacterium]REK20223.1 MAG: hypothetical protein DWQ41_26155 [Planctomycetota bacterium]REK35323.1 MAG: hypothetical protein DWQ45_11365 [Planctomycetota bacterium]
MATTTKHEQTAKDLKASLDDIGDRFPVLSPDELFVMWFLRAYVTKSEARAAEAVSGGAQDKGGDAVFIDDAARSVFIVQGKYREQIAAKAEKRADVVSLAEIGQRVSESDNRLFQAFIEKTEGHVAEQLKLARRGVLKQGYRVWLYFATTGKVSEAPRKEAESLAKKASGEVTLDVIDGRRIIPMVRD